VAGVGKDGQVAGAAEQGISDESLEAYRRQLQPKVLALFGEDDVATIPRPELALRIGNLLSYEIERSGTKLGLLHRRKLVTGLIDWLLQCNAMQPDERQEFFAASAVPEAKPGAVTPPEGTPSRAAARRDRLSFSQPSSASS